MRRVMTIKGRKPREERWDYCGPEGPDDWPDEERRNQLCQMAKLPEADLGPPRGAFFPRVPGASGWVS